jgi:hypothetical protein
MRSASPFPVPKKLEPDLARVRSYWEGLKRAGADMPFCDDVNVTAIPEVSARLMLIDVFDKPVRFRLGIIGAELQGQHGQDAVGKFLDEIEPYSPLQYLSSQSSATIESRAPTYYRHIRESRTISRYSRLLLPMWEMVILQCCLERSLGDRCFRRKGRCLASLGSIRMQD